jgi:hypothetical protein
LRKIIAKWSGGGAAVSESTYLINESTFNAGEPAAKLLEWRDYLPSPEQKLAAETFFQGLPTFRAYQLGEIRYLRTSLRPEAFQCRRAASRVQHSSPGGENLWYRTDLWLNADVPFGVVRRESTILDPFRARMRNRRSNSRAMPRSKAGPGSRLRHKFTSPRSR